MFCGFPLGAAFGGFLAAWMIPHFGWRSVLVLGGVTPLVLLIVLLLTTAGVGSLHGRKAASRSRRSARRLRASPAKRLHAGSFIMTETAPQTAASGSAWCCRARTSSAR